MSWTAALCFLILTVISRDVASTPRKHSGPYQIQIHHVEECKGHGDNKLNLSYNLDEMEPNIKTWSTNWTWPYGVDDSILLECEVQWIKDGEWIGPGSPLPFGDLCSLADDDLPELFGELLGRMGLPPRCSIPAGTYELRDWPFVPFNFSTIPEIPYGNYTAELSFLKENTSTTTYTIEHFGCVRFYFEVYPPLSSSTT